jgi:L-ascorbate metabolism protein UlaG (beta-lactamase superfamily)
MKRRELVQYAGGSALAALGLGFLPQLVQAQASPSLRVQWLGHTCFLFTGNGRRILVNPFRTLGCTAGYRLPKVAADLVMISSQLLDEGAVDILPSNPSPLYLYEPGVYPINQTLRIEGIRMDHDRVGGKRFGTNVAWKWTQGGINILHLGGAAAPISIEQKILMGQPDLLFLPVGGGPKSYTPEEAKQAVQVLNPRMVIPTHYRTKAADKDKDRCDLVPVDQFLSLMEGVPIRRGGDALSLTKDSLPKTNTMIQLMSYAF